MLVFISIYLYLCSLPEYMSFLGKKALSTKVAICFYHYHGQPGDQTFAKMMQRSY